MESIIWYTRIVCCPEFGGCPLFGSSKCIESMGIVVGASTVVHYTVDVRCWECPLMEVPLYYIKIYSTSLLYAFLFICRKTIPLLFLISWANTTERITCDRMSVLWTKFHVIHSVNSSYNHVHILYIYQK